jgi:ankyrin repeat protein
MAEFLQVYGIINSEKLDELKNILESGVDINVPGGADTLLSAAVNTGNIEIVKLLLDYDADTDIKDEDGTTALFSEEVDIDILKLLLDYGADVNIQDNKGKSALFYSNYDKAKLLITSGINVNIQDIEGKTALFHAMKYRQDDLIKLLVDSGADVNIQDNKGLTVLFSVVIKIENVKLIIEAGADVNVVDNEGRTALFYAEYIENPIVELFIESGVDVNIQDNYGKTALFYTESNDKIKLLIEGGINVNIQNNNGHTRLFYAEDVDIINLLIEAGADVNIQNKSGKTALFYFSKKGDFQIVKLLVSKGASINFSINKIFDPRIKRYLISRKTLWKRTVREKLMTKMESTYNYRSEKVCDVFNVLDKEELFMVADLYGIDEKLSRFQICQELKDILDDKIKGKEEALGVCNNTETGILQTDIKDIDPRSFFTFEQTGKIYCEEVEALYEQIFTHGLTKNAFTNQPFSEDIKKRVKKHYNIYIKDRISEEEKPQETLTALYAKLHGFLYYPVTNTKFEDSSIEDLEEFVSSLPIRIQKNSNLLEYKKNIMKGLIDYIEDDQDAVVQPDGRRIKTSAVLVTQLWNDYYD